LKKENQGEDAVGGERHFGGFVVSAMGTVGNKKGGTCKGAHLTEKKRQKKGGSRQDLPSEATESGLPEG